VLRRGCTCSSYAIANMWAPYQYSQYCLGNGCSAQMLEHRIEDGSMDPPTPPVDSAEKRFCAVLPLCQRAVSSEKLPGGKAATSCVKGELILSRTDYLYVHALLQCALNGPCDTKQPALWGDETRKWEAWAGLGPMTTEEAKNRLVTLVDSVMPSRSRQWFRPCKLAASALACDGERAKGADVDGGRKARSSKRKPSRDLTSSKSKA